MKIVPITNTNISTKGSLERNAYLICEAHRTMWNRQFAGDKPEQLAWDTYSLALNKACEKLFEGKSIKEIWDIRKQYRIQAEKNYKQLKKMISRYFTTYSTLYIEKNEADNKFHAFLKSQLNDYKYDFGAMELSEHHNNFSDIDSMTKLIEKIKSLTKYQKRHINSKCNPVIEKNTHDGSDDSLRWYGGVCAGIVGGL